MAKTKPYTLNSKKPKDINQKTRKKKSPKYKSFKLSKPIKHPAPKLPGSFKILGRSLVVLKQNWKLFGGIVLVYGLLNIALVKGLNPAQDVGSLKTILNEAVKGGYGQISTGITLYGVLLGSSASTPSEAASIYQTFLILISSLAFIWTLRQVSSSSSKSIKVKDSFYKGMYPFVPFVLVLLVICLQLVPLLLGGSLYASVLNNGLAVSFAERILWTILFFFAALFSLYMVSSSVFALYIVTLPDMTPMKALRSARELVRYRRWRLMRKVVFLPIALFFLIGIIMVPLIVLAAPLVEWIYFAISMATLAVVHSYMYSLYRELL